MKKEIMHKRHDGKYLCNEAVACKEEKMTDDWDKVTCKNCPRVKLYY